MSLDHITPLGIASLALLAERPMHPYEMYQLLIQRSEDRVVKVRPGSLYHVVDRLAAHELVRAMGTTREGNRPERTSYEITEAGRRALEGRVSQILSTPVNEYPEFPLGIGEAHNLDKSIVARLLLQRANALRAELQQIAEGTDDVVSRGLAKRFWLNLDYSRTMIQAEIDWLLATVSDLEAGALPWEGKVSDQPEPIPAALRSERQDAAREFVGGGNPAIGS